MSLKDFMQQLQEQDNDVIYSKPPEESIQIIPPSKVDKARNIDTIKVIPPKEEAPKVIKFKLNLNTEEQNTSQVVNQQVVNQPVANTVPSTRKTPEVVIPNKKPVQEQVKRQEQSISQPTRQRPQVERPVRQENTIRQTPSAPPIDKGEELFRRSETPLSKKEIWFEYYNKALKSNKNNFITDKCKRGRFMIDEENKFIVLSDYDTYDKDANEILRDSWF